MRIEDIHEDRAGEGKTERRPTETMADDPRTDERDPRSDERDPRTGERDPRTDERDLRTDENDPRTDERAPGESPVKDAPLELFGRDDVNRFRAEWREVQAQFVDDPRAAVQGADQLVAEVMGSLTSTFTNHKHELEGQWQQGSEAQTEDLRQALRRYRTFFDQLLDA